MDNGYYISSHQHPNRDFFITSRTVDLWSMLKRVRSRESEDSFIKITAGELKRLCWMAYPDEEVIQEGLAELQSSHDSEMAELGEDLSDANSKVEQLEDEKGTLQSRVVALEEEKSALEITYQELETEYEIYKVDNPSHLANKEKTNADAEVTEPEPSETGCRQPAKQAHSKSAASRRKAASTE